MSARRQPPSRSRAALSALAALVLAGCGTASADPQGGGQVTPVNTSGKLSFPDLGYRKTAPRLPANLPAGAVLVFDLANQVGVQPAQLTLALGATAAGLHWSQWGSAAATGRGTATVRVCTSSCGAGYDRRYPATITLSDIRTCDGHRYYEQAAVSLTASGPLPQGVQRRWPATLKDPC